MINKQRGIGFVGWCTILAILAFFVLIILRLFPLYNEKFQVDAAMKSVSNRPDAAKLSTTDIKKYFVRNAQIGGTDRFNSRNIKDYLSIPKRSKGEPKSFNVQYEARSPFFDVIEFVLVYDNTEPLEKNAEGN